MREDRGNSGERIGGVKYSTTPPVGVELMQYFDRLPANIRRVIAAAPFNYDTVKIARALDTGFPARRMEIDLIHSSHEFTERAYEERGFDPFAARALTRHALGDLR
ncbi:MAG: hypothetical protein EOS81_05475 [Mesorhizobium sp.]|uniref:hypothetical protein n=1 Tax=Mesorhizobium sp. TaxID=1871066 RepID=UPI000FD38E90|nr:hypothetical protein EN759_37495 [Mesorhizobium sp. M00.F.Ca.ET.038.03.1.1]RWF04673.1 MAG: hypothetical protein EOS81_05475 [Mesorhizobium sp.]